MKVGEIKAEALMLMGVNTNENISYTDIESYKDDPNYATYLYAMVGAINRCLTKLYISGAVEEPIQHIAVDTPEDTEIAVNDIVASLIPLYVVGDVYATDEPSIAASKRNEFEQVLEQYVQSKAYTQSTAVEVIYEV